MTGDLLDQATRLAANSPGVGLGPILRALVERVRAAEAEADKFRTLWDRHGKNDLIAERDEARAKLDKVRLKAELEVTRTRPLGSNERRHWVEVLAILDRQEPSQAHETAPVRPESCQLATEDPHGTNGPQNGTHETEES